MKVGRIFFEKLFILAMFLCLVSFTHKAEASTINYSGTSGDLSWSIDSDGVLNISGSGDFERATATSAAWAAYSDYFSSAVVNVENITSTAYMFSQCENLKSIEFQKFDTSKVTDMSFMFNWCFALTSLDVSGFDTGNVTDMNHMFNCCYVLSSLDLKSFDTGNVTNMSCMFGACKALATLNLQHFDTGKVTDMSYMFSDCESLSNVDLSSFDTYNVTSMSDMFLYCYELRSLDLSSFDTGKVTNMRQMFSKCIKLSSLDIISFDTGSVSDVSEMFSGCTILSTSITFNSLIATYDKCFADAATGTDAEITVKYDGTHCDNTRATNIVNTKSSTSNVTLYGLTITDLSNYDLTLSSSSFTYNGSANTPSVSVSYKGTVLEEEVLEVPNYKVFYHNNINAGTAVVSIVGTMFYTGRIEKTYTINPLSISNKTAALSASSYTYDGTAKTPSVTVQGLEENVDYNVSYSDNTKAGTATVTIAGEGNYADKLTKTFTISPISLEAYTVTLGTSSYTYDGTEKKPSVTVKNGTTKLTAGTDYTISYSNNKNVGTAAVTITGKGNYTGSVTRNFTINKQTSVNISSCTVTLGTSSYSYDGNAKKPSVTVKNGTTKLTAGTDYTLSYSSNTNVGTAAVIITGKGNYTGSVTKKFTINPQGTTLNNITDQGGNAAISWTKQTVQTSGYEIQYAGNSAFTNAKTITVTGSGTTSKKSSAVSSLGKCYVRIRTYKTVGSTNFVSTWSASKLLDTTNAKKTTGLSAKNTASGIYLSWKDANSASGYQIYRKASGASSYSLIKTVTAKKYTDTTASNGTLYTYKIRRYNKTSTATTYGAYSSTASYCRLTRPVISSMSNTKSKALTVKWKKNSKAAGVKIYVALKSSFSTKLTFTSTSTSRTLTGAKKGKTYYVKIMAYKKIGGTCYYSAFSTVKSLKIKK